MYKRSGLRLFCLETKHNDNINDGNKERKRKGRNPQTGKVIKIKAKKIPKFVSGKAFRDAVK